MRFAPEAASTGAATWGAITGTMTSQTDLQTALDAKFTKHDRHIYVPFNGSIQTAINDALAAGHTQDNPCWIVPQESRTENLTMYPGIYLTGGDASGTHCPIVISGTVTINAPAGTLTSNRFSIERLAIVGTSGGDALFFTGANPQRLFLRDVWLTAQGTGGYCFRTNNADATSHVIQADDLKLSHNGSGWHIYCATGSTSFDKVETSGNVRVAFVGAGASLNLTNSECRGTSAAGLFSVAAGGTLTLTSCKVTNDADTNPNGIALEAAGAQCSVIGTVFSVAAGTGQAVLGVAGSVLAHASLMFAPGTNTGISAAITQVNLNTTAARMPFAPDVGAGIASDNVQAAVVEALTDAKAYTDAAVGTGTGFGNFAALAPGRVTSPSAGTAVYDATVPGNRMWLTPFSVPCTVNVTAARVYRASSSGPGTFNVGLYSTKYVAGTGHLPDALLVSSFVADMGALGSHSTPLVITLNPGVRYWAAYSFSVLLGVRCWHAEYMHAPFGCVPDGWSMYHMAYNDISDLGGSYLPATFGSRVLVRDYVDLPQFVLTATPA